MKSFNFRPDKTIQPLIAPESIIFERLAAFVKKHQENIDNCDLTIEEIERWNSEYKKIYSNENLDFTAKFVAFDELSEANEGRPRKAVDVLNSIDTIDRVFDCWVNYYYFEADKDFVITDAEQVISPAGFGVDDKVFAVPKSTRIVQLSDTQKPANFPACNVELRSFKLK